MKPTISLIISSYDRPDALAKVLAGIRRQTEAPMEIIIADDGGDVTTHGVVERWNEDAPLPVKYFRQEQEGQKTPVLNQCLAAAKGNYIVLLDSDCVPHAEFIADHAKLAEPGYWVQGRRCYVRQSKVKMFSIGATPILMWMAEGKITGWTKGIRLPFPLVTKGTNREGILGCNMAFWRDDAVAVNGFDEGYESWGHEDADFGVRLYHLGRVRKFVRGHAIVYHLNHSWLDRQRAEESRARLEETIRAQRVRCERGLSQYLTPNAKPS